MAVQINKVLGASNSGAHIIQWNIQGANNYDSNTNLSTLLTYMDDHKPAVVMLQETLISADPLKGPFKHRMYNIFQTPRTQGKSRGMLTAVLKTIPCIHNPLFKLNDNAHDAIDVTITTNNGPLRIINIYRKHGVALDLNLVNDPSFHNPQFPTLIGGDFNQEHPLWGSSRQSSTSTGVLNTITFLDNSGAYSVINTGEATHKQIASNNICVSTCIDVTIASNHIANNTIWELEPLLTSDHCAIRINLDAKCTPIYRKSNKLWATRNANWAIFQHNLDKVEHDTPPSTDLNSEAQNILSIIIQAGNLSFKKPSNKPPKEFRPVWKSNPKLMACNKIISTLRKEIKTRKLPPLEYRHSMPSLKLT